MCRPVYSWLSSYSKNEIEGVVVVVALHRNWLQTFELGKHKVEEITYFSNRWAGWDEQNRSSFYWWPPRPCWLKPLPLPRDLKYPRPVPLHWLGKNHSYLISGGRVGIKLCLKLILSQTIIIVLQERYALFRTIAHWHTNKNTGTFLTPCNC